MQLVDRGSQGPWPVFDDFMVDEETAKFLINHGINLDGFASYHKLCDRYFQQAPVQGTGPVQGVKFLSVSQSLARHLNYRRMRRIEILLQPGQRDYSEEESP